MARRVTAISLVCAAVITLAVFARVQAVRAASSPNRVVGIASIGGLAMGATYAEAVRYFGAAGARAHFDDAGCTLRYPALGVSLWYRQANLFVNGTPKDCVHFEGASVIGTGWHTRNGLFVGDPTSKLRRLFPHVYDTRHAGPKWDTPSGSIEWDITITCCGGGERPALSAMVERGRVVAFVVEMVGH